MQSRGFKQGWRLGHSPGPALSSTPLRIEEHSRAHRLGRGCHFLVHWSFLTLNAARRKRKQSWGRSELPKLDQRLRSAREHSSPSLASSSHLLQWSEGSACRELMLHPAALTKEAAAPHQHAHCSRGALCLFLSRSHGLKHKNLSHVHITLLQL